MRACGSVCGERGRLGLEARGSEVEESGGDVSSTVSLSITAQYQLSAHPPALPLSSNCKSLTGAIIDRLSSE